MGPKIIEILIQFVATFATIVGARYFLGEWGMIGVLVTIISMHQYHIGNLINRVKELENAPHS